MFKPPEGHWQIVPAFRCPKGDHNIQMLDRWDVEWFLRGFLADFRVMENLRILLAGTDPVYRMTDDEVVETISWRLATRELVFCTDQRRAEAPASGGGGGDGGDDQKKDQPAAEPAPATAAAPESSSKLTWIEVHLVDQNRKPVPGRRYRIKLTDGSTQEGTLDSQGRVRFDGIPPGQCMVCFPDIHGNEWEPTS